MAHPELTYHAATLRLIEADIETSSERLDLIQQREAYCKCAFPAAVAEWYALAGIEEFFTQHTGDDLVPLEQLGEPRVTSQGYLRIATENQAVVEWYVPLQAGDDPPVLDDNGQVQQAGEGPLDLSGVEWTLDASSFSAFIFELFTDAHCGVYFALDATDASPTAEQLQELQSELALGPVSKAAGRRTYRFFTDHGVLAVHYEEEKPQAQWFIRARHDRALRQLLRLVWGYGSLSQTLTPAGGSRMAEAGEILKEFGRPMPRPAWWKFWQKWG